MALVVYADFDSPEGYLASRRASALVAAGIPVDWRAVQRTARPVIGVWMAAGEREALARRFADLDSLLLLGETLPRVTPAFSPNTEAAVSALAEAHGSMVADDVRRLLFELYWTQGADIGNPNVLRTPLTGPMLRANAGSDSMRRAGYAVSLSRGPITTQAYRRIDAWRNDWQQLDSPPLPVVLVEGATLVGLDAVRRLGKEIVYRGAEVNPDLDDPRRYPAVTGRPTLAWVSQIGGRWRHLYKLTTDLPGDLVAEQVPATEAQEQRGMQQHGVGVEPVTGHEPRRTGDHQPGVTGQQARGLDRLTPGTRIVRRATSKRAPHTANATSPAPSPVSCILHELRCKNES